MAWPHIWVRWGPVALQQQNIPVYHPNNLCTIHGLNLIMSLCVCVDMYVRIRMSERKRKLEPKQKHNRKRERKRERKRNHKRDVSLNVNPKWVEKISEHER